MPVVVSMGSGGDSLMLQVLLRQLQSIDKEKFN